MNPSIVADLARVADSEAPREQRARAAAEMIRTARGYRWVGIYDVGDDEISLIADAGVPGSNRRRLPIDDRLHSLVLESRRATICKDEAIAPVLGAESGIVIGTLDIDRGSSDEFSVDDFEFLEDCAALLRPLYD
jgi:putative methionine-R-sulfoxide reductase with GAF domain